MMIVLRQVALLAFFLGCGHPAQAALDRDALAKHYFDNDAPWYRDRIPFFEASDTNITDVYYYRWQIFRAHQRDLGPQGYITTEFIDDVGWQFFPSAWLDDATQFHFNEARWCRDRRFRVDHANFIYNAGFDVRHFSENMAASVWNVYLVDGVQSDVVTLLDGMRKVYDAWQRDHFDTSKGLYYIEPLLDATEYTISSIDASCGVDGFTGGVSFRPSINAYQYGNARAIANIANLAGNPDVAKDYNARADSIKTNFENSLWNSTFEHFIDRFYASTSCSTYWDFIRGRELAGYVPWLHDLPSDKATFAQSWKHLIDTQKLAGPFGLRTVEPSYEYYMRQYRYDAPTGNRECQWNGPVWPYQTSQVLAALANVLDHYPETTAQGIITADDFMSLLSQYTDLHYSKNRGGYLNIEEDYFPDTGRAIVGLDRSSHYFHSSYIDLVISGLVGIRPSADDVLNINPLAVNLHYFRLEGVIYHGNEIAVQWDVDGSRYGTRGLIIEVDGSIAAQSTGLQRLSVQIPRKSPPRPFAPIAKSVQLQNKALYADGPAYPVGSVSVAGADSYKVQDAIDGRIWFFPKPTDTYTISHGWQTPAGDGSTEVWYMVDFGANTSVRSCELAFFTGEGVGAPASYWVEVKANNAWQAVSQPVYPPIVANGITWASWSTVNTSQIRLVFTPPKGLASRLVEWKVFSELVDGTVFTQ
ncbi:six-hairpin glycosidase [Xylariaceae sp. AK1471]|nr:six-hairpin glycosidase [Xylariaceae sp. AK1471]